jgi:Fanconi-associated nuclease 1
MPDLILWDPSTGRVKFSEVKSENDRLSEVQRAWIAYLSQSQIEVEVCLVNRVLSGEEAIDVFTEQMN